VLAAATRRVDDATSETTMLQVFFSFSTNVCQTATNGAPLCYQSGSHFLDFSAATNVLLHTYIMFAIFLSRNATMSQNFCYKVPGEHIYVQPDL
jgi:hypothetical protein